MRAYAEAILRALDNAPSRKVTVFGDFCLDKYLYIDPDKDELSVETGLTAYQVVETRNFPGGGGAVASNLRALGAQVYCVGLLGNDGEGYDLLQALERAGADTSGMVRTAERPTNTYTKPMRRQPDGRWREMNRLDKRSFAPLPPPPEERLIENLRLAVSETMGVVVADQYVERNFAAVTDRVREALAGLALANPEKFFYADSRNFAAEFRNVIIKCNESELLKAMEPGTDAHDTETILRNGRALQKRGGNAAVITLGARGACVFEESGETWLPAFPAEGPLDTVGAGDATSAGTILGLTLGLPLPAAALLGACASSITIQQLGVTGTATAAQVAERLRGGLPKQAMDAAAE